MGKEDLEVKKLWKFSYEAWNGNLLQGTFVASQEQIDWIIGLAINFGDLANKGLDVVARMDSDYFEIVSEDEEFVKQFKKNLGGVVGMSPFNELDDEQLAEYDLEFGEVYVNGKLVRVSKPEPRRDEFVDEGIHVVVYGLMEDIIMYDPEDGSDGNDDEFHQEEMDRFLSQFEIVAPDSDSIHLSERIQRFNNGEIHCMTVIMRLSDGALFGYRYYTNDDDTYWDANGKKYGFDKKRATYVWLPVKPFTMIGYHLDTARYEMQAEFRNEAKFNNEENINE